MTEATNPEGAASGPDLTDDEVIFWRWCVRKRAYPTSERAQEVVDEQPNEGLQSYACLFGNHYHVGHPRRGARGRAREVLVARQAYRKAHMSRGHVGHVKDLYAQMLASTPFRNPESGWMILPSGEKQYVRKDDA